MLPGILLYRRLLISVPSRRYIAWLGRAPLIEIFGPNATNACPPLSILEPVWKSAITPAWIVASNAPGTARSYVPNRNADTGLNGYGRVGHCPHNRGRDHLRLHLIQPCDHPQQDHPKQSS